MLRQMVFQDKVPCEIKFLTGPNLWQICISSSELHSYTMQDIITNLVMNINFNSNPIPVSKDFIHIYYIIQKNLYSNLYLSFSNNPEIKSKNYVVFKTY